MKAFLMTQFVMLCLSIVIDFLAISKGMYPRTETKTLRQKMIGLALSICFAVWAGVLLFC